MKNSNFNKYEKWVIAIGLGWFLLTAWFSNGFFHNDEHYQIVEFAEYIAGHVAENDLAWEFGSRIRPATQPYLAWIILESCDVLGITNHYHQAFVLRLLTGFLSFFLLSALYLNLRSRLSKKWRLPFLIGLFFLWFIPFVQVRFSSETWSGLLFLAGFVLMIKEQRKHKDFLLAGLFFGFAFLFRFQIAFALMAIFFWLLIIGKASYARLISMVAMAAVVMALGVFLDTHFYGEFSFTPWNYLKVNLIEGVAASFGESPWYGYFYRIFRFSFFPIGTVILLSFLYLIYKRPRDPVIWVAFLFFVGHSLIAHKESRFLFPVAWTAPYLIVAAIQELYDSIHSKTKKVGQFFGVALLIVNLFALITASFTPAGQGRAEFCQILQEKANESSNGSIQVYISSYHPTIPWGLPAHYYDVPGTQFIPMEEFSEINENKSAYLAIIRADLKNPQVISFIEQNKLKKIAQSQPHFFEPFLKLYGFPRKDIIELYAFRNEE